MIIAVKERLANDIVSIVNVLRDIGCYNINVQGNKVRFGIDNTGSGTGNILSVDTLKYYTFSHDKTTGGDIFTLVGLKLGLEFQDALHWLADYLGVKGRYREKQAVRLPFGGFFKEYTQDLYEYQIIEPPKIYNEDVLEDFIQLNSELWNEDGIPYIVQEIFGVGYDPFSKRITLPIRDEMGELCGVLGRINREDVSPFEAKYISLIQCERSKVLFGLYENYKNILEQNVIFIAEAEKSVLQALAFGVSNVVAVGKHDISKRQAMLIKSTAVNDVVIAFDEGVPFEDCYKQIERLKIKNPFFHNRIGILYDFDNKYLPKGSKMSPYDLDKTTYNEFVNNCIIWENEAKDRITLSIDELFGI